MKRVAGKSFHVVRRAGAFKHVAGDVFECRQDTAAGGGSRMRRQGATDKK